eukprot:EG_transcript_5734
MKSLLNKVENKLGVDIDGDGRIGDRYTNTSGYGNAGYPGYNSNPGHNHYPNPSSGNWNGPSGPSYPPPQYPPNQQYPPPPQQYPPSPAQYPPPQQYPAQYPPSGNYPPPPAPYPNAGNGRCDRCGGGVPLTYNLPPQYVNGTFSCDRCGANLPGSAGDFHCNRCIWDCCQRCMGGGPGPAPPPSTPSWSCPQCTYQNNAARNSCEMCNTARPYQQPSQQPYQQPYQQYSSPPNGNYYAGPVAWNSFQGTPYSPAPIGMMPAAVGSGPVPHNGRKKALLIGINYFGTKAQLRGCINDVHNMQRLLQRYGFPNDSMSMVVLTDDTHDPKYSPTRHNIISAMQWLTAGVQPGEVLFFHYSGHGSQQRDNTGTEEDGMDETILPVDFKTAGQITDNIIFDLLVRPLPSGVRLTSVMDCCHSGTGMDLPYTWTGNGWICENNPCHSQGDVQLFSGCTDSQTSADAMSSGVAGGAMTSAFIQALEENPNQTYPSLMNSIHRILSQKGYRQRPQLTSSQQFDLHKPFSLSDITPNMNREIGRQHKKSKKKKMLMIGGAVIGGLLLADLLF